MEWFKQWTLAVCQALCWVLRIQRWLKWQSLPYINLKSGRVVQEEENLGEQLKANLVESTFGMYHLPTITLLLSALTWTIREASDWTPAPPCPSCCSHTALLIAPIAAIVLGIKSSLCRGQLASWHDPRLLCSPPPLPLPSQSPIPAALASLLFLKHIKLLLRAFAPAVPGAWMLLPLVFQTTCSTPPPLEGFSQTTPSKMLSTHQSALLFFWRSFLIFIFWLPH